MREWDYDRHLRRTRALDEREFARGVFEAEDVPDGDYTTERARVRGVWESKMVHHRGRRRRARVRAMERTERELARRLRESLAELERQTRDWTSWVYKTLDGVFAEDEDKAA